MKTIKRQGAAAKYFAYVVVLCAFLAGEAFAQDSLEILASQIDRGTSDQKRSALFQVRNLKTAEASRLAVPALRDRDELVRATAAASIGFLPSEEAAGFLLPLLSDKKPFVRKETAYALGKTRSSAAIRSLIETIQKDKVQEVKDAATFALGETGNEAALDALAGILRREPGEKEDFMRRAAAHSIGQIANTMQNGGSQIITPQNPPLETNKALAIGQYRNLAGPSENFRQAVSVLIKVLQSTREADDVRREAAFALGEIGDSSAIPVLQAKLTAKDYYLAKICRESLQKLEKVSG